VNHPGTSFDDGHGGQDSKPFSIAVKWDIALVLQHQTETSVAQIYLRRIAFGWEFFVSTATVTTSLA
jgi:hypothetical protein